MKRTKTRKTTTGSRIASAILVCTLTLSITAAGKNKKKAENTSYAVIAGTVFRSEGFALGGADVSVGPKDESKSKEFKKLKTTANNRGEFAIRVPAVTMEYRVDVKMQGFHPQSKDVTVEGEQRKELNFLLEPAK